jgi:hypothetical protein
MSYLTQYLPRASAPVVSLRPGVRVDVNTLLNRPGLYGDAHVHVFVEDTSGRGAKRWLRRAEVPSPRLLLQISDCMNEINLEFDVSSVDYRENSLHKIDTLLGALQRFRDGLAAEAELYERRELELRGRP